MRKPMSYEYMSYMTGIPPAELKDIVEGNYPIDSQRAQELTASFGMTPDFWMNSQDLYDDYVEFKTQRNKDREFE